MKKNQQNQKEKIKTTGENTPVSVPENNPFKNILQKLTETGWFKALSEKVKSFISKIGGKRNFFTASGVLLAVAVVITSVFIIRARGELSAPDAEDTDTGTENSAILKESEDDSEEESADSFETTEDSESESESDESSEPEETTQGEDTEGSQQNQPQGGQSNTHTNILSGGQSGNQSNGQPGNQSGGSSSAPSEDLDSLKDVPATNPADLVHVYPNAPSNEAEDNSETVPFMPLMLKEKEVTTPGFVFPPSMKPGALFKGDAAYSTTLVGYDEFLFCADSFSDYDGTAKYTDSRIPNITKLMTDRNDYIESIGKKLYLLIIPNKNTVYHEYMPDGYPMGTYRRIDQIVSIMRNAGINVIDARESLNAAKAANPARALYYKTDTHWNNHGGFEAYRQLMSVIQKDFPNAVVHSRSDYQINYCQTYMKDQTFYLGFYDMIKEIGPVYTLKSGKTAQGFTSKHKDPWGQFAFCYQWPNGYSDRLYYYQWTNSYNAGAPSMYMIRDSYSIALSGFLKDSFYKSTFNWTFQFSKSEIAKSGADVVIIEVCEKHIADMLNQRPFSD